MTDIASAVKFLDDLGNATERQAIDVLNTTARAVERRSIAHAAGELTIPALYLRRHIRTTQRATKNNATAKVSARQRGVSLSRFQHRVVEGGVEVSRVKGKTQFIEGAFLITLRGVRHIAISANRLAEQFPRVRRQSGTFQVLSGISPNQILLSTRERIADHEFNQQIQQFFAGLDT